MRANPWYAKAGLPARCRPVALLALAGCMATSPPLDAGLDAYPPSAPSGAPLPASEPTRAAFARLGPGINFGNMLEAPREGDWGSRVQDDYPALVWQAGFRHVRLPVRWSAHAGRDAQARIDPVFMARVDSVGRRLLEQGLIVAHIVQHYCQLNG